MLLHSENSLSTYGRLGLEFQERDDLSYLLDLIEILDYDFQENEPEIPELEHVENLINQVDSSDDIDLPKLSQELFKFDESKLMYSKKYYWFMFLFFLL